MARGFGHLMTYQGLALPAERRPFSVVLRASASATLQTMGLGHENNSIGKLWLGLPADF